MEFLNRALAQVSELFRSMTPGARITAGLLLVIAVTSIGYLFVYRGSGPDVYLMNGKQFTDSQIQAMEAAFAKANLGSFQWEGSRVRVPRGQQNAYVAAMAENGALPENWRDIVDSETKNTTAWASPKQQEQASKAGKQKKLEMIIKHITGIQEAYVVYDTEPKRGSLFSKENTTTASVNVQTLGSQPLADFQITAIRTTVAKAIAGLQPESVAVTHLNTGRTYTGGSEGMPSADNDPYSARKRMYEQQWKEKILDALSYVQGATVEANVELDRDQSHHKELVTHDPKGATPLQTTEKTHTTSNESGAPGGRVGYVPQQPNTSRDLSPVAQKGSHEEQEESETTTHNMVPITREISDTAGLTPKRVTVVIGIPDSYFEEVWRKKSAPAAGGAAKAPDQAALEQLRTEEIAKIKEYVAKLLPTMEGVSDAAQFVQVASFPKIIQPEVPPPGMGENTLAWLAERWSTLGLIGLGLVALLMLRSIVRAVPAGATREKVAETPAETSPAEEHAEPGKPQPPRLRRFSGGGPSLRDELSEMVQEDPDAAANVLRTWIGSSTQKS